MKDKLFKLGNPIGSGAYADIYPWNEGKVLKLFKNFVSIDDVEYEARVARIVLGMGLPVPVVAEQLEVNGRIGLVYEHVEGPTMFQLCETNSAERSRCARLLPEVHGQLHNIKKVTGLKSHREWLSKQIRLGSAKGLPANLQEEVLKALDAMPEGDRLCHNDFWPGNILMSERGPIIIDWEGAAIGDPLSDVANTLVLKEVAFLIHAPEYIRLLVDGFYQSYLKWYFRLRPGDEEMVAAWKPIIAASCFGRKVNHLPEDWLIKQIETGIAS